MKSFTFLLALTIPSKSLQFSLASKLQEEYNVEILLLSFEGTFHSQHFVNLHEDFSLPFIHLSQLIYEEVIFSFTCCQNESKPEDLHFMSNLPWRNPLKSLLTWIIPQNLTDLSKKLQFMER